MGIYKNWKDKRDRSNLEQEEERARRLIELEREKELGTLSAQELAEYEELARSESDSGSESDESASPDEGGTPSPEQAQGQSSGEDVFNNIFKDKSTEEIVKALANMSAHDHQQITKDLSPERREEYVKAMKELDPDVNAYIKGKREFEHPVRTKVLKYMKMFGDVVGRNPQVIALATLLGTAGMASLAGTGAGSTGVGAGATAAGGAGTAGAGASTAASATGASGVGAGTAGAGTAGAGTGLLGTLAGKAAAGAGLGALGMALGKGAGGQAGNEFLFGKDFSNYTPEQQNIIDRLGQLGITGLEKNTGDFAPIEAKARQDFANRTVPGIAERFSNSGGSSAFSKQLGEAGAELETNLGALRSQHERQQQGHFTNLAQLGISPKFPNATIDASNKGGLVGGLSEGLSNMLGEKLVGLASKYI